MTDNCFWKHGKKAKKVGSERDKQKEVVPLSENEQILHNWLCTSDFVEEEYDKLEDDNYGNGNVSVVSSCMGSITDHDDIDLDEHETSQSPDDLENWKNLTEAEKVSSATDGLKFLVNAKKRKFNHLALSDGFVEGNDLMMESIKKDWKKAIQKMRHKFDLVEMSIT